MWVSELISPVSALCGITAATISTHAIVAPLAAVPRSPALCPTKRTALFLVCPQITGKTNLLPNAESNAIKLKQHFEALSPAFIRHPSTTELRARLPASHGGTVVSRIDGR